MPIKLIVTHKSPDLDAIMSVWMLKRFDEQNFGTASVGFVNPGEEVSLEQLAEYSCSSYEVVHVDTGGGVFDHHTPELANLPICAASLVFDHLKQIHPEIVKDEALHDMVNYTIDIDHFADAYWEERREIRSSYYLSEIISQLKSIGLSDEEIMDYGLVSLDAIHALVTQKIKAEADIRLGKEFETPWGKGVGVLSSNNAVVNTAQKMGYVVVIRKDPDYKYLQIKALPRKKVDLLGIYEKIKARDSKASWYLHPSHTILLNGADKTRGQIPSKLTLDQVIGLFETT